MKHKAAINERWSLPMAPDTPDYEGAEQLVFPNILFTSAACMYEPTNGAEKT